MSFRLIRESSLPLHVQLLDELRHNIISGALKPHDRVPGENELVEQLGISRATVQRAWQAAENEGLIYRIAGKGTYVAPPRDAADSTTTIGFLMPEYRGAFAAHLLSGAESIFRAHGYHVLFAHTDRRIEEENRVMAKMVEEGVRGFVFVPAKGDVDGRFVSRPDFNIPIVLLDRPIPGLPLPCVTSNNYIGGMQAMQHLLGLGHRRILFVARPHLDIWTVSERYRAYQDVLRSAGAEPLPPMMIGGEHELSSYEAYTVNDSAEIAPLVTLLEQPDRPTAIFAVNDWIALKVLRAAKAAKLRLPEDLSLVGFDNMDIAEHLHPPLTTVAQDAALMGAVAARRLVALIDGETVDVTLSMLPTQLIVRGSTSSVT